MSYHDLYITTNYFERTSIFNLPYSIQVQCTRAGGWQCWETWDEVTRLMGSEFGEPEKWLVLDVDGHVILDSRNREE